MRAQFTQPHRPPPSIHIQMNIHMCTHTTLSNPTKSPGPRHAVEMYPQQRARGGERSGGGRKKGIWSNRLWRGCSYYKEEGLESSRVQQSVDTGCNPVMGVLCLEPSPLNECSQHLSTNSFLLSLTCSNTHTYIHTRMQEQKHTPPERGLQHRFTVDTCAHSSTNMFIHTRSVTRSHTLQPKL